MTSSNLPATVAEEYGTGLEDIEDEITAVPRIGIDHKAGVFKDSLSGEEFPRIYGVLLGMVKQRVMWEPGDIEPGAKPQCKSQDSVTGYPNMSGKPGESFPWAEAPGLDPNTQPKDEHGRIIISCDGCPFAQWGPRDAKGKSKPPPCKERHTYPVIYNRTAPTGTDPYDAPYMESGIVSFQGSGITPSKKFLSAFVRNKLPLYSAVVEIKLNVNKRGMVEYSVPEFTKLGQVPTEEWELYGRELAPMRDYLKRAPRPGDDSDPSRSGGMTANQAATNAGVATTQVSTAPMSASSSPATSVVQGAVAESEPTQAATEIVDAVVVDDDLPF